MNTHIAITRPLSYMSINLDMRVMALILHSCKHQRNQFLECIEWYMRSKLETLSMPTSMLYNYCSKLKLTPHLGRVLEVFECNPYKSMYHNSLQI